MPLGSLQPEVAGGRCAIRVHLRVAVLDPLLHFLGRIHFASALQQLLDGAALFALVLAGLARRDVHNAGGMPELLLLLAHGHHSLLHPAAATLPALCRLLHRRAARIPPGHFEKLKPKSNESAQRSSTPFKVLPYESWSDTGLVAWAGRGDSAAGRCGWG